MLMRSFILLALILASLPVFASRSGMYSWVRARPYYTGVAPKTLTQCRQYLLDRTLERIRRGKRSRWRSVRLRYRSWTRARAIRWAHSNCKMGRRFTANYLYFREINGTLRSVRKIRVRVGRRFRTFARSCYVSAGVRDFRISNHVGDAALAYYLNGSKTLYRVDKFQRSGKVRTRIKKRVIFRGWRSKLTVIYKKYGVTCPFPVRKVVRRNVKKYRVVSNTGWNTKVVALILDNNGVLAWRIKRGTRMFGLRGIRNLSMNQCFGKRGKSHSSYVAFAINKYGRVYKIKGKAIRSVRKTKFKRYRSLVHFKRENGIYSCR